MEERKLQWFSVKEQLPKIEDYYAVRFESGFEDEIPFRIRPNKNIYGFMSEEIITHWAILNN